MQIRNPLLLVFAALWISVSSSFAAVHQNPLAQIIGGKGFITHESCGTILNPGSKREILAEPQLMMGENFTFQGQHAGPTFIIKSDPKYPGKRKLSEFDRCSLLEYNFLNLIESNGHYEMVDGVQTFVYGKLDMPESRIKGIVDVLNRDKPDIIVGLEVESFHSMQELQNRGVKTEYLLVNIPGNDDRISIGLWINSKIHADLKVISTRELNHLYMGQTERIMSRDFPVVLFFEPGVSTETGEPFLMLFAEHGKSQRNAPRGSFDPESKIKRGEQAKVKKQIIEYFQAKYPKARTIVTGDVNADFQSAPELSPLRNLNNMFEIQTFMSVPVGKRGTHAFFPRGFGAIPVYGQLDVILLDSEFSKPGVILQGGPMPDVDQSGNQLARPWSFNERNRRLSDHLRSRLIFNARKLFSNF